MNPKVRVGRAGPKGKGLFAAVPIPPETVVATYRGSAKWVWNIPEKEWPFTFQVGYDRYALPSANSRGRYINHSCDPNCVVSGRSVVTRRPIAEGEELTFDYSTDVDWAGFEMGCMCGSAECRKVVRAYRFLPKKLKLRYGRYVADYIRRKYKTGQRK